MTSTHTRSVLRSAAICLAPAIVLVLSPVAAEAKKPAAADAKKAKPAAAKKKAVPSPSDAKKAKSADKAVVAPSSSVWEAPPREGETPPAPSHPAAETKPAADSAPAAAAPAETPAAPPQAEQPPSPPPPPPEEETLPALIPPAPTQYVEHLGPSAYPGSGPSGRWSWWPGAFRWGPAAFSGMQRGLYGGSMWLEPSFHGLQWPYMARTGVGVSGSVWVDSGYEEISSESPTVYGATRYLQQARAVLRVTPTYVRGWFFIQAQAEMVANGCQGTGTALSCDPSGQATVIDTDDLWLRVGQWNVWDIKVGRFEGWELYHTGMGLDINTLERRGAMLATALPPDYYGVNFLHDRAAGAGLGYIALHGYPTNFLRMEVLTELGTNNISSNGDNYLGARPSAILDLGWVKIKGGYEYEKRTHINAQYSNSDPSRGPMGKATDKYKWTSEGYGGGVQFVLAPYAEFGASLARGSQVFIDEGGSPVNANNLTRTSVGGFGNFHVGSLPHLHFLEDLLLGAGLNWTTCYDAFRSGENSPDYTAHLQAFGAIQYLIFKQLFVKAVISYARGDFQPSGATGDLVFSNTMYSTRVRLMYLY